MNITPRFRRGGRSPLRPGLMFWRYNRGREHWVTPNEFEKRRKNSLRIDKKWKHSKSGRSYMRAFFTRYNHTPKQKEYHSSYYKQPVVRERIRRRYNSNPKIIAKREASIVKKQEREAYLKSPEYLAIRAARCKSWRERNKDKKRKYERIRHRTNINHRLAANLRNRIATVLRRRAGAVKTLHTEELIGCSKQALVLHLQSQFTDGMTMEDLMAGRLHVDHHVPCALFDLVQVEQQLICFNYRNLKPMWPLANIAKSDFIEHNGQKVRGRELRGKIIPFPNSKAA